MKTRTIILILLVGFSLIGFSQETVKKIYRENMVGQKIKFLLDNKNQYGYMDFGKTPQAYPYLEYEKYKQRIATIIEKNGDVYTLKMDGDNEIVYFKWSSFSDMPKNIGILSLLDSARENYLNKTFANKYKLEYKVIKIEFAEDSGKFSQLYGPYNVYLAKDGDTTMMNIHFTETYGREGGYIYSHEKERVFENIFTYEKPFTPLTKDNIEDKFYIDIDKMDDKKTYIHKKLANDEFVKHDMGYSLDYSLTGIFLKVVVLNGQPKLEILSNYYSNDWLFHSYVKIKIGETTKQTSQVKGTREVLSGGKILERNYYNSASDFQISKWMAENYTKDILVRLYGTDYYDDINLSDNVKLSIKETYDLYNILKNK